jgi:tetratricopeptide (TPR) repeat protein
MSLFLAMLIGTASGLSPETEAVMGPRLPPAERRIKGQVKAAGAGPSTPKPAPIDPELDACAGMARQDSTAAIRRGEAWIARHDSPSARQCLGFAQAQAGNWSAASDAFATGARLAANDAPTAARLWAQAGNAALAGGDATGARTYLDKALSGSLAGAVPQGEAHLDRARALVALKDEAGARNDLDDAIKLVPQDPLAWLLSATLARRQNDLPLARQHIAQAARLADDDASVALEQGVIAALAGEDVEAKTAFERARKLAPGTPIATNADNYLAQLGAAPAKPVKSGQVDQSR